MKKQIMIASAILLIGGSTSFGQEVQPTPTLKGEKYFGIERPKLNFNTNQVGSAFTYGKYLSDKIAWEGKIRIDLQFGSFNNTYSGEVSSNLRFNFSRKPKDLKLFALAGIGIYDRYIENKTSIGENRSYDWSAKSFAGFGIEQKVSGNLTLYGNFGVNYDLYNSIGGNYWGSFGNVGVRIKLK